MDSLYCIDPVHLRTHEINYELKIRELQPPKADVVSKRKCLRECFRTDMHRSVEYVTDPFDFNIEKAEIQASLLTLEELANEFDGLREEVFRRFNSRYNHLIGRLLRFPPTQDVDQKQFKDEKIVAIRAMMADVREIMERNKPNTMSLENTVPGSAKHIPVFKWGITFDGATKSGSVNSFLQRVEELQVARGTSEETLFSSAVDLFTGSALVWYRAVKSTLTNWRELKAALRRDFLPSNFDEELMTEIRGRTQGANERVTIYVATMMNLFKRLTQPPSEDVKLEIIRKNLLPFLQVQLVLQEIPDIKTLTEVGRKIEDVSLSTKKYQPPPHRNIATLEPDLAYDQPASSTQQVSTVQCWRCHQVGHLKKDCKMRKSVVCHGCGAQGVIKPNCQRCSRNLQTKNVQGRSAH